MSRQARRKSNSGIYHIVLRGINQQAIFEDEEDNARFIETLVAYKEKSGYRIFAYCLMGNHIHLLMKVEKEGLDTIMKRIAGSYVYWYNWKYDRSGHLFQDRFKSEAVENDSYFLTVLRYIHQNPVKAGLCKSAGEYKFSSFNDYTRGESAVVDVAFSLSILDKSEFERYHQEASDYHGLDAEGARVRIRDAEAMKIMAEVTKCKNASEFQALESGQRDSAIRKLRAKGLSIRQTSRLTGVSKGLVEKATRQ